MDVLGSIANGAVGGLLGGIGTLAKDLRTAITGDIPPEKQAEIAQKLQELDTQLMLAQIQVNLEEAKSEVWWKAGWRCFIGWGCGFSLVYSTVLRPFMVDVATVYGSKATFVTLDTTLTLQVLLALLGVGIMRSYDKAQSPSPKGKE